MKALSNMQGPMGGEPLCFHEAALIFIGHKHETGFLNWGQGRRGLQLFRCLPAPVLGGGLRKLGELPLRPLASVSSQVMSEKLKQFLVDFCFSQV